MSLEDSINNLAKAINESTVATAKVLALFNSAQQITHGRVSSDKPGEVQPLAAAIVTPAAAETPTPAAEAAAKASKTTKPAAKPTPAPTATPAVQSTAAAVAAATEAEPCYDDVRREVLALVKLDMAKTKEILAGFGVDNAKNLKPEQYGDVIRKLQVAITEAEVAA